MDFCASFPLYILSAVFGFRRNPARFAGRKLRTKLLLFLACKDSGGHKTLELFSQYRG
jgi:hypothetical protein